MRTRDQKRAADAYEKVGRISSGNQAKFKTLALKLPAMVLQCGALQTLAFYRAKSGNSGAYEAVRDWLHRGAELPWGNGNPDLVDRLVRSDLRLYRLVAREAVEYGTWLKRAAETLLKDVKEDN